MSREKLGYCKSCGKRILFIRMNSGKFMPVDELFVNYKLDSNGKDRIVTPMGEVITCVSGVNVKEADGYGYISHFATCDKAKEYRKR